MNVICRTAHDQKLVKLNLVSKLKIRRIMFLEVLPVTITVAMVMMFSGCEKNAEPSTSSTVTQADQYTITQATSDEAQMNTIAFDGLAYLTGNLGSQSFLPPGKVADYSGFQCLRDNDPTKLGHNTDFVTIIAYNVLHLMTEIGRAHV